MPVCLADTHALLWYLAGSAQLGAAARWTIVFTITLAFAATPK